MARLPPRQGPGKPLPRTLSSRRPPSRRSTSRPSPPSCRGGRRRWRATRCRSRRKASCSASQGLQKIFSLSQPQFLGVGELDRPVDLRVRFPKGVPPGGPDDEVRARLGESDGVRGGEDPDGGGGGPVVVSVAVAIGGDLHHEGGEKGGLLF